MNLPPKSCQRLSSPLSRLASPLVIGEFYLPTYPHTHLPTYLPTYPSTYQDIPVAPTWSIEHP
jgi:hypothetical protein